MKQMFKIRHLIGFFLKKKKKKRLIWRYQILHLLKTKKTDILKYF